MTLEGIGRGTFFPLGDPETKDTLVLFVILGLSEIYGWFSFLICE